LHRHQPVKARIDRRKEPIAFCELAPERGVLVGDACVLLEGGRGVRALLLEGGVGLLLLHRINETQQTVANH